MLVDLSHPIRHGLPSFPGDPALAVVPHFTTSSSARCNLSCITMSSHFGTHLDAMFHFVEDGRTLDQMPLDWFYGPARLIRIPKGQGEEISVADFEQHAPVLQPGARILFETGWHREYGTDAYYHNPPSMTQDAARYLASRKLRLIGMDTPTPGRDFYEIHHILLGHGVEMVIVEGLANLDKLPADREFRFIGFPLNFEGRDGSPIRAVADLGAESRTG